MNHFLASGRGYDRSQMNLHFCHIYVFLCESFSISILLGHTQRNSTFISDTPWRRFLSDGERRGTEPLLLVQVSFPSLLLNFFHFDFFLKLFTICFKTRPKLLSRSNIHGSNTCPLRHTREYGVNPMNEYGVMQVISYSTYKLILTCVGLFRIVNSVDPTTTWLTFAHTGRWCSVFTLSWRRFPARKMGRTWCARTARSLSATSAALLITC